MRMPVLTLSALALTLPAAETVTTRQDQRALAVTIYNDNLALVKDQREVRLPKGDLDLAFQEVSAQIRPETALLRDLAEPKGFWVNEQNFDFDLLTPQKLLEKYVGRKVTVVTARPEGKETREEAEVLATTGGVVLKFADRIETAPAGRIVFPDVPANLRARPTLVVNLHSPSDRARKLELSYLTGGLSWRADYVANLAPDGRSLDLAGWVTLTNQSGAAYPDATLQLVAGDLHRTPLRGAAPLMAMARKGAEAAPAMQEEGLFEYHLYTLDRPTTLRENQTKQVALLTAQAVPVRKDYELRGDAWWFQSRVEDAVRKQKVGVWLELKNREDAGLGMPLPKGVVRVYQRDSAGRAQFIGEDGIDHTPRNETLRLKLGDAFDVTASRRQTDFAVVETASKGRRAMEAAFQVEVRNAKSEPVTVTLLEPIPGDWEMQSHSLPFTKAASNLAKFEISVPAGGATQLTYRVKMRF